MSIIGSSFIQHSGNTGPEGPIGNPGNTGNTGPDATGCVLNKGNTASYISSIRQFQNPWGNIVFTNTDNSSIEFIASPLIGATLFDSYGVTGINLTSNSLFSGITQTTAGITFIFKRITSSSGSITVKNTSDLLTIDSQLTPYSQSGFTSNELIYFNSITGSNRLSGITLSDNTINLRYKNNDYFDLNTIISPKTKIVNIPSASRGSSGQYIDVSQGGLFYINTPNGILGFTGLGGTLGSTGSVRSLTLITQSDYIWKFPENVWFESGDNYLGCRETIIGLTTKNNGQNWNATIFGRGFKASPIECNSDWDIGSCYYGGGATCNNYVYRADCFSTGGLFCLNACSIETEIFDIGSCCVNGICRDGVSEFLCKKYGGRWWSPEQTGASGCDGFNCWDPCTSSESSCCVGATCLDRYTESECNLVSGTWYPTKCNPASCNPFSGLSGACCVNESTCIQTTFYKCVNEFEGIFVGIDENCNDINCDCFTYESSGVGCNKSINEQGSGVKFTEKIIDLSALDLFSDDQGNSYGNFCFNYRPYSIPDRWLILKTKDTNPVKQNTIRGAKDVQYDTNYKNFITDTRINHPVYHENQHYSDVIIYDTGCTSGTQQSSYRHTIRVTSNDVEMSDQTDSWYKKIRLWNLSGCDPNKQNYTLWSIGISCGECPSSVQQISVEIPSVNTINSIEKIINNTVTFTLWNTGESI